MAGADLQYGVGGTLMSTAGLSGALFLSLCICAAEIDKDMIMVE
jgi:hypothetical protein